MHARYYSVCFVIIMTFFNFAFKSESNAELKYAIIVSMSVH